MCIFWKILKKYENLANFFIRKIAQKFSVQGPGYTKIPLGHQVAYPTLIKIIMTLKNKKNINSNEISYVIVIKKKCYKKLWLKVVTSKTCISVHWEK